MTVMDAQHSELFDMIPAYALGALSRDEKARVESFLATSAQARTELETYQRMMVGFATLAPKRKAPSQMTGAFQARLAAEADKQAEDREADTGPMARPRQRVLPIR